MKFQHQYLHSAISRFKYYKNLGEGAFEQLQDEDLFYQYNEESNSIAIIVKHLWGNMRSRWTDFLTTDGEKADRHRDTEFIADITTRADMMKKWDAGWKILLDTLESLTETDFETAIYIRNEPHSVVDAINRQLAHYAYHVGQIVYICKMKATTWNSLSIPRGQSENFNQIMKAKAENK